MAETKPIIDDIPRTKKNGAFPSYGRRSSDRPLGDVIVECTSQTNELIKVNVDKMNEYMIHREIQLYERLLTLHTKTQGELSELKDKLDILLEMHQPPAPPKIRTLTRTIWIAIGLGFSAILILSLTHFEQIRQYFESL